MRSRRIRVGVGIAIVVVLVAIGGVLVVQALGPHISEKDATTAALRQLQQMNPKVTGYTLVSARDDPAPDKIYDERGNLIGSESRSACPIAGFEPTWVALPRGPRMDPAPPCSCTGRIQFERGLCGR